MKNAWKNIFSNKLLLWEFILSTALLAILLFILTHFLNYIEARSGATFSDPILNLFKPIDLTWLIFITIYGSLITALVYLIRKPLLLIKGIQLYSLMVFIRMVAMYLLPLEPPSDMITLIDPFVEYFGTGSTLTKDLFFSGHTATLFILFLVCENHVLKTIFLAATIIIAVSVILQHVHYTIDVFSALFFSFAIFKILGYVRNGFLKHFGNRDLY